MFRRSPYMIVLVFACALTALAVLFAHTTTQARVAAGAGMSEAGVAARGPLPDFLRNMPEDMRMHHDSYDNLLTALYEQWLAGNPVDAPSSVPRAKLRSPHTAFSPLFGADVRMSNAAFSGNQNEFQIDTNPTNSQFAVGTSNDGMTAGVGIYRTTDGGATWTAQDAPVGTAACCDPAAAYAYDGTVYVGVLDTSPAVMYTIRSTDNGATWGAPSSVAVADRNNLVVDNGAISPRRGNLYLTYSDLGTGGSSRIKGYRSTDGGTTWGTSFFVGRTNPLTGGTQQSSQPRAASDGTLYVGYQYYETGNQAQAYDMLARSTDGGSTFTNYTITGQLIVQAGIPNGRMYFCTMTSGGASQNFRHRGHPIVGVSPTNPNTVYAAWTDGRYELGGYTCPSIPGQTGIHSDIVFSRSTDGGATWTTPLKVNADTTQGRDQYYPWMDVTANGAIWLGWQDRRDDPSDILMRWYTAFSTDGGQTWAETPVADLQSRPSSFIGDYHGLAAENDRVLGMWWDSRSNASGDPYTDPHVPATTGTPTATPTATATPTLAPTHTNTTVPSTSTPTRTSTPTITSTNTPTPTDTPTSTTTSTPTNTPTPTQILVGHVTWQGRPAQPNALQQLPISLTLKLGATEVNYPGQTTGASGFFTVTVNGLAAGTYDWRVKGPKYVANSGTVALAGAPQTNAEMGLMRAGDCNDDNCVNVQDVSILKNTLGKSQGDPGYDARADFNGDNTVSIADFNLLKGNFGTCGAPPIRP